MIGRGVFYVDNPGDVIMTGGKTGGGVEYASVSVTAAAGIDAVNLTGTANLSATADAGTDLSGPIGVKLVGNDGNNLLTGNAGDNNIDGGRRRRHHDRRQRQRRLFCRQCR
ncbi:MAG: hypothetical protein WDN06_18370 [Asticcacaulis sp.]